MIYKNRQDAGQELAKKLKKYEKDNPIIIALPRGGVILGYEVAKTLKASLDIIVPRKIGAPSQPEYGIGAIAPEGVRILNMRAIESLEITEAEIEYLTETEAKEMNRRMQLYREGLEALNLEGKTVIMVDDGIATGVSTKAAVISVRKMNPKKIILAVPVCPPNTAEKFRHEVDEFLCLCEPPDFYAIGEHYDDFKQISDEEVINLIKKAKNGFI